MGGKIVDEVEEGFEVEVEATGWFNAEVEVEVEAVGVEEGWLYSLRKMIRASPSCFPLLSKGSRERYLLIYSKLKVSNRITIDLVVYVVDLCL